MLSVYLLLHGIKEWLFVAETRTESDTTEAT